MKNFKKFLVLCTVVGILVGFTAFDVARATPLDPTVDYTMAQLIAGGTWTIQDKVFSDFSYSGADDPSLIHGGVIYTNATTGDIHGWQWTNANPLTGNQWTSNFVLSYTISVAPSFPSIFIIASKDQIEDGLVGPSNLSSIQDVQTSATLNVNMLTLAGQTAQAIYAPQTSIHTVSTATIPAPRNYLTSYEQNFFEVSLVPEPSMMLLLGFGLLGLVGVGRKLKK